MRKLYSGDTFTHNGGAFRVTHERDDMHAAPWLECDGHGVVTGWRRRDYIDPPRGFWRLSSDRLSERLYNWRETMAIAKRDCWGLSPADTQKLAEQLNRQPTPRDIRKEAVRKDYEFLRGWCNDEWEYIGVIVELVDDEGQSAGESEALWGVESFGDYSDEVAKELADEILARVGDAKDAAIMAGG